MKTDKPTIRASHASFCGATILSTVLSATIFSSNTIAQESRAQLEEIIVTAQRREQSLQDVPIAVTALTPESLATNRVLNVVDLSGLIPGLTVRPAAGGTNIASFSMRGVTSYGTVPGADRQVSVYLDGVYVGSPRGSIFDLPDIVQMEVLRGPQGTLFGRNATAGAINITTRQPSGEFGFRQDLTFGNYNRFRSRTSVDLPSLGPLSVAATYVRDERDGDIRNLGGGTRWDRSAFGYGTNVSPDRLGNKDKEGLFVAATLDLNEDLEVTYKFDYHTEEGSPEGVAPIWVHPQALGPTGPLLEAILATSPNPLITNKRRPRAVNNEFHTAIDQMNKGHSLTATWSPLDNLTIKNIAAYRESSVYTAVDLLGLGGVANVAAALGPIGAPICIVCTQQVQESEQWSNELQLHYQADRWTITAGALYYRQEDRSGSPPNTPATTSFFAFPNYEVPIGSEFVALNKAESIAGYGQVEYQLTQEVEVVGGVRVTRDEKSGTVSIGVSPDKQLIPAKYEDTQPTWLLGLNYRPNDDLLLYARYSTAFVSGGSVGGIDFDPEDAFSWEAGIKSDFLDRRLRTNLSVYHVTYENYQTSQTALNVGRPELGTVIVDLGGDVVAKGVELEATALLGYGLSVAGNVSYSDVKYKDVREELIESVGGNLFPNSSYNPTLLPDWTANLSANYDSPNLFGSSYLSFNISASWRSDLPLEANPARAAAVPEFIDAAPSSWIVNARMALRDIALGSGATGELALWGRNLTDNDHPNFSLNSGSFANGASFVEARTYGVDLSISF